MRVALYARYSDEELQNEKSADDQLAELRLVVARRGWVEVEAFADCGISGSSLVNRPAALQLLAAAKAGRFDLVLAEDLDRVSRDQEDTAHLFKRLNFAGVLLETLAQGRITTMHVGLGGTMNQLFLEGLARKTRRGLTARVNDGFSAGGLCYGYRIKDRGVLGVDQAQADVIRRIYDDYARGEPPRAIAHALNAEGVAGPRGGTWAPTTISGDRRAGDGILCQELYIGVRVFNRRHYRKDPDTARRSGKLNPESEWIRRPAPELRILTDEQWEAAQARHRALSAAPASYARKPRRLLSGLIRCALCSGPMVLNGPRYECSLRRDRGTCHNRKVISAAAIEARVIEGVRTRLLSPAAIAEAAREYQRDMEQARRRAIADRAPAERELAEISRRIDRATEAHLSGAIELPDFQRVMAPLKARRAELQASLAQAEDPAGVVQLHPGAVEVYRQLAEGLAEALAAADADEVRQAFRAMIDRVDFQPIEGHGKFALLVHGRLARVLQMNARAQESKNPTAGDCGVSMGAGARSGQHPTALTVSFAA